MTNPQNKKKKVTLADVAAEAGVGQATVDRFLSGRTTVKPSTAEKISRAMAKLDYRPVNTHSSVEALTCDRILPAKIGFIFPSVSDSMYDTLLHGLKEKLSREFKNPPDIIVYECDIQNHAAVASLIETLSHKVGYIGLVALDDPIIGLSIKTAADSGVKIFTLFSPLADYGQVAHLGLDDRKAGRSAAWIAYKLIQEGDNVAIFQGHNRFLCQEICEISFRSYFREKNVNINILGPILTHEKIDLARKETLDLVNKNAKLDLVYAPCGGVVGIIDALKENKNNTFLICHGPFPGWQAMLINDAVDVIIYHDIHSLIENMIEIINTEFQTATSPLFMPVNFEIKMRENI
ncbi:LacI family DNA-binding transcriptional regulator [Candidatus Pantoea multigeneris]|uniref:Substrate-binding domain-containing protein n=1 Tax=Candidatus Pantoea multigeneris TaxID=2608357 RepID=A0ABX0R9U0_9GAMM|nr:LacI family DNA-binding transcriptional regulator [Pantoea multigeneris]NIF21852.1 substrate-binding domain-containing protein [Pantoea multigeneris]